MEPGSGRPKPVQCLINDEDLAFQLPELWSCSEANLLFGVSLQVGVSDIAAGQLESVQLSKEANNPQAPQ